MHTGINISGGQKQRVCLARLVYSEAPVCLLDDPTSALDSVMSAHVFEQCVHGTLERQRRTRLIVTNVVEPSVLRRADRVIWMDDGRIRACGPFDELAEQGGGDDGGAFSALLAVKPRESEPGKAADTGAKKAQVAPTSSSSASAGKLVKAEDRETGTVASHVYGRLFTSAGLWWVAGCAAAFIVSTSSQIGRDWYLAYWTNSDQADGSLWSFLGTFTFLTMSFAMLTLGRAAMLVMVGFKCSIRIHAQMSHAVLYSPLAFFDVTPTGRVLNRFAKDTENVDVKVWESWRGFLDLLFPMIGTLLLVSVVTPTFLVVIPILGLFAVRVQNYYRKTSRELKRLSSIARSPMYDWFSCTLDGLSTIRAHDMAETFTTENSERSDEANKMQYIQKICDRWLGTRLEMMGNLLCFVAMLLGVAARGEISGAYIGLALASSMRLARTVNYAVRTFTQLESEMTSVERVLHFADLETERYVGEERSGQQWPPPDGTLEMEHVDMRYRPGLPLVLEDVSFRVKSGDKLGVVGRTGSGKSSLIQVLFRLTDCCAGRVLIGGVSTADIGVGALRSALAICPQDPVIFSGTVRSNLDPLGTASDADMLRALERVGLRQADGLDAQVREGGSNFSGGQRQLLCLARTLLRKSMVLVLDEATSSVSPELDLQVQEVLRTAFGGVTKLVIAHRLATVLDADAVLVMGAGRVLEHGGVEELAERPGGALAAIMAEAHGVDHHNGG